MFGFEQVAAFTHEFESAFDRVRKGEAAPDPELIAIALNAKDFIRSQIERPEETDAVIGVCILADLRKLFAGARRAPPDAPPATWLNRPPSRRRGASTSDSTRTCDQRQQSAAAARRAARARRMPGRGPWRPRAAAIRNGA